MLTAAPIKAKPLARYHQSTSIFHQHMGWQVHAAVFPAVPVSMLCDTAHVVCSSRRQWLVTYNVADADKISICDAIRGFKGGHPAVRSMERAGSN